MTSLTFDAASLEEMIDLIERQEASAELVLEVIRRLRSQVRRQEGLDAAVLSADASGWSWKPGTNEMNWSPYLTSMLGYAEAELPPGVLVFNTLLHPDDRRPLWDSINAHLLGATPLHEMEARLRHKNGEYRWVISRGKAVRDAAGNPVQVCGLHLDVTSRKRIQDEAIDAAEKDRPPLVLEEAHVSSIHCSHCGSTEITRSRWQRRDRVLAAFLLRALRCQTCGHRFYRPIWVRPTTD